MAEIEYQRDLNAFKELYLGLIDRFEQDISQYIDDAELSYPNYCANKHWIDRIFLPAVDLDLVRIPGDVMSVALRKLAEMEKDIRNL